MKSKRSARKPAQPSVPDGEQIPRWGESFTIGGPTIQLSDTCPIDNMIFIIFKLMSDDSFVSQLRTGSEVAQMFKSIHDLGQAGEWTAAKVMWLIRMANQIIHVDSDSWSIQGGEYERFVQYLGDLHNSRV